MKKIISIVVIIILVGVAVYSMSSTADAPKMMNGTPDVEDGAGVPTTVSETPAPTGAQGKINIDEVCQGALIRMTFPDGASAEKFVADCKEGKHPEVIEQFKADMNVGAGAEI